MTVGSRDDTGNNFERRLDDSIDSRRVAELATLPEHEWRITVLRLMLNLQDQVDANTDITADTQEAANRDLGEIKDILLTVKGGLKFLGWMGRAAKWLTVIFGLFAAVVAAVKAGDSLPELLQTVWKHVGK